MRLFCVLSLGVFFAGCVLGWMNAHGSGRWLPSEWRCALPSFAPNKQVVRELALRAQTALTFFLLVWCALGTLQSRPRPEPWAFLLGVLSSVNKTQSTKNHAQSLQRKSQQFPICYQMSWHSSLSAAF